MEIVDVIKSQNSQNRDFWYELIIIENKSTEIASLENKWLFVSKDGLLVHPSNLTCALRYQQKNEADIIFENIKILPNEKFHIYSGNDANNQLNVYGGKGMVATSSFKLSGKSKVLTLANKDGNIIHSYSYNKNPVNIFKQKNTNLTTLFE